MGEKSADGNGRERMLSLKQAAARFQVAPSTVGGWVRDGKLRHVRLPSGRAKLPESVVEAELKLRGGAR